MELENELRNDIFVGIHVAHSLPINYVFKNIYYISKKADHL